MLSIAYHSHTLGPRVLEDGNETASKSQSRPQHGDGQQRRALLPISITLSPESSDLSPWQHGRALKVTRGEDMGLD